MSQALYRFGEVRVDPVAREFWRGEHLVAVPPHVFDCLAYLFERHDRAVGRDELVAAVWGHTEVRDTLIGQTIRRIRRELGDDGKDPRFLRTIPRFGFRWVAPLERLPRQSTPEFEALVVRCARGHIVRPGREGGCRRTRNGLREVDRDGSGAAAVAADGTDRRGRQEHRRHPIDPTQRDNVSWIRRPLRRRMIHLPPDMPA